MGANACPFHKMNMHDCIHDKDSCRNVIFMEVWEHIISTYIARQSNTHSEELLMPDPLFGSFLWCIEVGGVEKLLTSL